MSERPAAPRPASKSTDPLFGNVRTRDEYESNYRALRRLLISREISLGFARKRLQIMVRDLIAFQNGEQR